MAKSNYYRWLVGTAFGACMATLVCTHPLAAQENGRGGGDRGWRRNGDRPRGDGPRGRDREEQDADLPAESKPSPTATTTPSSTSFGTTSETDKIRKWASDTLAKNDKDGNKILEGNELTTLGQSGRESDLNKDGKITSDELFQNSMKKAGGTSSAVSVASAVKPTVDSAGSASKPADERKLVNDTRKSYRFKSTKDRLPSWRFADRDKNGDGQVSMSEYSRSWSDRTAAEFQRYDTDKDGMISSEEVR